jgi:ketosteroid isomerase-like protein
MDNESPIVERVRTTIHHFWAALKNRAADRLATFYESQATVWSSTAGRIEPGRLAVMRRCREYFGAEGSVNAGIKGVIDVRVLGDIAIACYAFEFAADRAAAGLAQTKKETIQHGRATQVFVRDGGEFRIVHEHLSVAAASEKC